MKEILYSKYGSPEVLELKKIKKPDDLICIKELVEVEKIISIFDKNYSLVQTVAVRRFNEKERKKGILVISMAYNS